MATSHRFHERSRLTPRPSIGPWCLVSRLCLLVLASALSSRALAGADVPVHTTGELRQAFRDAKPGTRILLAPGEYEGGQWVEGLRGEPTAPVEVAAADPSHPPVIRGGDNCLHLADPSFVVLSGLVLEGARQNGLNVDDAGSFDTPARGIRLVGLLVRDVGSKGNQDGIKLSGLLDFSVEGCTVERWGRGGSAIDMVGCREGRIVDCTFRDRETGGAANAVQTKGGSRDIAIRRSRFEHAGERAVNIGGSTGLAYFRPKPEGFEAKDIVVEGCTFVGSMAPVAFVGVDGATVRFNTIYRPRAWVFRILQETREPGFVPSRNGAFTDNLIVYRSDEIRGLANVGPATAPETFTFARNYWYCLDRPGRGPPELPSPEEDPAAGRDPLLRDPERGDLEPSVESPARGHGASALPQKESGPKPSRGAPSR